MVKALNSTCNLYLSHDEAILCHIFRTWCCNNWRKRHGKHVLRKRQINKYRLRTLRELLMEDNWDESNN